MFLYQSGADKILIIFSTIRSVNKISASLYYPLQSHILNYKKEEMIQKLKEVSWGDERR